MSEAACFHLDAYCDGPSHDHINHPGPRTATGWTYNEARDDLLRAGWTQPKEFGKVRLAPEGTTCPNTPMWLCPRCTRAAAR